MRGELAIDVKSVYSDKYFVRPCEYSYSTLSGKLTNDLSMTTEDGEFLHICGENDWAFLALDLLRPINEEAKKIMKSVQNRKAEYPQIKAVMLGKNDKRIMDVYFGGRSKCDRLFGLPIIETDELNEVKFLVEDTYLPF